MQALMSVVYCWVNTHSHNWMYNGQKEPLLCEELENVWVRSQGWLISSLSWFSQLIYINWRTLKKKPCSCLMCDVVPSGWEDVCYCPKNIERVKGCLSPSARNAAVPFTFLRGFVFVRLILKILLYFMSFVQNASYFLVAARNASASTTVSTLCSLQMCLSASAVYSTNILESKW